MSVYEASRIKRSRATKAEIEKRHLFLLEIVAAMKPMTVRQVFYQATVAGLVDKTEPAYGKVQRDLVKLRREGILPYSWIADSTRWQRKPMTFRDPSEAARRTADFYRKNLWADAKDYIEIWLEKDALAGVVFDVTAMYDCPLMVSRGYASLTFLHQAAENINKTGKPTYIYHFGDYDPSGQDAASKIEDELREFADEVDVHFCRAAVRPEQIEQWNLPTRPTKKSDTRSKRFGKVSCELDAIHPQHLRQMVKDAIERHLPAAQFDKLMVAEKSERDFLTLWASLVKDEPNDGLSD